MPTAERDAERAGAVCALLCERLDPAEREQASEFVRQLLRWVPAADLIGRSAEDLCAAALAHWQLMRRRARGELALHIRNPSRERDGWESPHTVIQLVCDDMPFIVDSVTMELGRLGFPIDLVIHPVMRIVRDGDGRLLEIVEGGAVDERSSAESVMHVEVIRTRDRATLERLQEGLLRVLGEVRAAVEDWQAMRAELAEGAAELPHPDAEVRAFLEWLADNHFTFLGYREYDLVYEGDEALLRVREGSGLGILRTVRKRRRAALGPRARALAESDEPLVLTKANSRSTIHRPAYLDYIGIKRYDGDGRVCGERRFLGLYTSSAYKTRASEVPLVRKKVATVMARAGFPPDSHDAKALLDIIESYPRDAILQLSADELFEVATGILGLGERQRLRLFVTVDPLGRFADCLVCIPRDRFNTENRLKMGEILLKAFGGHTLDWTLALSESLIVRVHYIVRWSGPPPEEVDREALGDELARVTRAWADELRAALIEAHGEERGVELHRCYGEAFPPAYRSEWEPGEAVADVDRLELLDGGARPIVEIYRPRDGDGDGVRCKLLCAREIALSDVLPTFEHMGARVADERPSRIRPAHGRTMWIYDFGLQYPAEKLLPLRELFERTFLDVLAGEVEDDSLGELVLRAGLDGAQIGLIRAIARYLRQAGIPFSNDYIQRTVVGHAELARLLVELFEARFDPDKAAEDAGRADTLDAELEQGIDAIASLDEDRILRSFLAVVRATVRTNYYVRPGTGRDCLSLKLDPTELAILPRPRPRFEIWVYSPRVEGVHLRGGRVARGGLRWSDRREDFRTEVLGLMKAQMVKNALIVPVGSKGGFVVKRPPAGGDRDALRAEAIACYETYLGGLLDVTDNIREGEIVAPDRVVRRDGDDPYLVVAADKGTATFSDIANGVSARYGFWLGDAFASGGSQGYDHKAMGITARGAWESVKRHFRELGRDIQREPFSVAGVGDMAGDVFGNGMLLSPQIKLLAAFNHMHVFIDPNPDPAVSFAERRRLFELPGSSWADYDAAALSAGGAVYERSAKQIELSAAARAALGIEQAGALAPNEVISAILRAPVDLLWNGGIGTYVKASSESHADAGDKANDALRVNARELRCRVVGEGGNLGFTQRGRIEYAAAGGRINTDAIDNVAGVNCSDHEVNIKILLDAAVAAGELTVDERNELLVEMTDAVAERVLYASYTQTQALSIGLAQAAGMLDVHARELRQLESAAGLDRELEHLPSEDAVAERRAAHGGLLAPELAVLLAHAKIHLHAELLESGLPEDEFLRHDLERYFPSPLPERFPEAMAGHRLRREIIATAVANGLVDRAGSTFAFRLCDETGASAARVARAYTTAAELFGMRRFWQSIEALDNEVAAEVQTRMLIEGRKLIERSTRWLLRALPDAWEIGETIARFHPGAEALARAIPGVLEPSDREIYDAHETALQEGGVGAELAGAVAAMWWKPSLFDLVTIAERSPRTLDEVTSVYFRIGGGLELNWLGDRINELPRADRWQTLARAALREDLLAVHRDVAGAVLGAASANGADPVLAWEQEHAGAVERWRTVLAQIKATRTFDTVTLPVALREARHLLDAG